jgi:hypothetical protein
LARPKKIPDKELICILHDEITELAEEILKIDWSNIQLKNSKKVISFLNKHVMGIIEKTALAKERGCAMEDRLKIYLYGIVDMGFKRMRKGT